ncbi:hypothetical protein C8R45DRAFT_1214810 [Mycena sanguinolenta]|nr:hypothetical protein C8R45DRAFT_1214810 [Mycena sanguinolenta]
MSRPILHLSGRPIFDIHGIRGDTFMVGKRAGGGVGKQSKIRSRFAAPRCRCILRKRTRADKCRLATIRTFEPGAQIPALLEVDPHVRFLKEGPGAVYFTVHRRNNRELIFKWGQSTCVPRRQLDYHACEDDGGMQMWVVAFEVEHHLIAERIIHLRLREKGYERVRFDQPCSCGHRHREYYFLHPDGTLEDFERLAWECLMEIGERKAVREILRPRRQNVEYSAKYLGHRR